MDSALMIQGELLMQVDVEIAETAALVSSEDADAPAAPSLRRARVAGGLLIGLAVATALAAFASKAGATVSFRQDAIGGLTQAWHESPLSLGTFATCGEPQEGMNTFGGKNIKSLRAKAAGNCCLACMETDGCMGYTFIPGTGECLLKSHFGEMQPDAEAVSGPVARMPHSQPDETRFLASPALSATADSPKAPGMGASRGDIGSPA